MFYMRNVLICWLMFVVVNSSVCLVFVFFIYKKCGNACVVQNLFVPLHDFCIMLTIYLFVSKRLRIDFKEIKLQNK